MTTAPLISNYFKWKWIKLSNQIEIGRMNKNTCHGVYKRLNFRSAAQQSEAIGIHVFPL